MGRYRNAYSNYANPELGDATNNLARAMFGSAQDDAYSASARSQRALAEQREYETELARQNAAMLNAAGDNPLLQSRALEALGYGPNVRNESGAFIRPVVPGGPQMSVPVFTDNAPDQKQVSQLARLMLGTGGNTQQTMAGFRDLNRTAGEGTAQRFLLNPADYSEDQLRGATILLKGPGGVDADFAPTVNSQNRLQEIVTGRANDKNASVERVGMNRNEVERSVGLDANAKRLLGTQDANAKRLLGDQYEVDRRPVIVGQNATAFIPNNRQNQFNNSSELRGQQSPLVIPANATALIPDDRAGDFTKGTTVEGKDMPRATGGSGGSGSSKSGDKLVTIPKVAQERMDANFAGLVKKNGIKLEGESNLALSTEMSNIWQNTRNPDRAADVVYQALKNGNSVNGVTLTQENGVFTTTTKATRAANGQMLPPKAGDIRKGYRYKAGATDPSAVDSWEKIK
jgi:hypothetical protein